MNLLHKDERQESLLNLIKNSSVTAEGRKALENWAKHMKSTNYGKRTGKPVSVNHDVNQLFPSSPSSSFDNSYADSSHTSTIKQAEGSVPSTKPTHSKKLENITKRLSGINTKLILSFVDDPNPSILMNGTENGSLTVPASSPYADSCGQSKTTTASIKRRLTFSEKKHQKSKDAEAHTAVTLALSDSRRLHGSKPTGNRGKKVDVVENSKTMNKNSSVVTMAEYVTNDPCSATYNEIMSEINSVNDQFAVEASKIYRASKNKSATETKIPIKKQKTKEKNGEISNASGRTTAKKRSADKPLKEVQLENMEFSGRVGVNGIARETPLATNENVLLSKIPKSAQKTDISENNNEFLQSSQTRSLRSWLRTSVPEASETRPSNRKASGKKPYSLRSSRREVAKSRTHDENENIEKKSKKRDREKSKKTTSKPNISKPVLFEVNASNITGTYEGHPNHTKTGPPMSTPRRDDKKADELVQLKEQDQNRQPNLETSKSSPNISVSKESVIALSSDDSLESRDTTDDYGETSPAYVSGVAAHRDGFGDALVEKTKIVDDPEEVERNTKEVEENDSWKENLVEQISKVAKEKSKRGPPKRKQNTKSNAAKRRGKAKTVNSTDSEILDSTKNSHKSLFLYPEKALSPPKLFIPAPSPEAVQLGLRRSKRARVRPLCSWNGEKLIYGEDGNLEGIQTADTFQPLNREVEEVISPKKIRKTKKKEDSKSKTERTKVSRVKKSTKKVVTTKSHQTNQDHETNTSESGDSKIVQTTYMDTTEPTGPPTVVEPPDPPDASLQCRGESTSTFTMSNDFVIKENGKNVRVDAAQLICVPEHENAFGRDGKPWKSDDPVRFTKGISVSTHALGSITIGPGQEKGLSKMKTDSLSFFVVDGIVEISIENAIKVIKKHSYFYIPPQNAYNIRNISEDQNAFLMFHQSKNRKTR